LALTGVALYLSFGAAIWYFTLKRRDSTLADAGFRPVPARAMWLMVPVTFAALALMAVVVFALRVFVDDIPTARDQLLAAGTESLGAADLLALLLVGAVVAPFVEEFFFRGILFRYLRGRVGLAATALITSFAFALVHFSPKLMVPLMVLGLILAGVSERYRSIYPAIAVHSLNNTVAILGMYAALS
jgi:membrane protease YdiL (CAAX protease family)